MTLNSSSTERYSALNVQCSDRSPGASWCDTAKREGPKRGQATNPDRRQIEWGQVNYVRMAGSQQVAEKTGLGTLGKFDLSLVQFPAQAPAKGVALYETPGSNIALTGNGRLRNVQEPGRRSLKELDSVCSAIRTWEYNCRKPGLTGEASRVLYRRRPGEAPVCGSSATSMICSSLY